MLLNSLFHKTLYQRLRKNESVIFFLSFLSLIFLVIRIMPSAITIPELTSPVIDKAHILSPEVIETLAKTIVDQEKATSDEIVILTVDSLEGNAIEDYSLRTARSWKIGKKGKKNGVLLVLAPIQKKVRIEVGSGLQSVLTDARCQSIIQNIMIPHFKAQKFEKGLILGLNQISEILTFQSSPTNLEYHQQDKIGFFEEKQRLLYPDPYPALAFLCFIIGPSMLYRAYGWLSRTFGYKSSPSALKKFSSQDTLTDGAQGEMSSSCDGGSFDGGGASGDW